MTIDTRKLRYVAAALLAVVVAAGAYAFTASNTVPTSYAGAKSRMAMHPTGPRQVSFDPYPFDQRPLTVQIAAKRVAGRHASEAAFRKAFARAPLELLEYELV